MVVEAVFRDARFPVFFIEAQRKFGGIPADTDYDALPLDGLPPFEAPLGLRASNPAYLDAQRAFYGTSGGNPGTVEAKTFGALRAQLIARQGDRFPTWVLDQLHIDVMLANRIAMGPGLASPRFRWVAFADPLMLPLDTRREAERTPDTRALYPLEAKLLQRYLGDLRVVGLPPSLERYQHEVVSATLERQHAAGAVAVKFEAARRRCARGGCARSRCARAWAHPSASAGPAATSPSDDRC